MSNAWFNPSPQRILVVINDLIDPELSLREVATRHNTSVAALSLWIALPETTQDLAVFHTALTDRVRLVATSHLESSASTIARLLHRFRQADAAPDPTLTPEQRQRAREFALRAATLLFRLANFRPHALGTPARSVSSPASAAKNSSERSENQERVHPPQPSDPPTFVPPSPALAGEMPSAVGGPKAEGVCAPTSLASPLIASTPPASMPSFPAPTSAPPRESAASVPSAAFVPSAPPTPPDFLSTTDDEDDSLLATAAPSNHEHWP